MCSYIEDEPPMGRKGTYGLSRTGHCGVPVTPACRSKTGRGLPEIFVDQVETGQSLDERRKPQLLERICRGAGIALMLNRRPGYEHSYCFISTVMECHLRRPASRPG